MSLESFEQVEEHLVKGGEVEVDSIWRISKNYYGCCEGCCGDSLDGVEDAVDLIKSYSDQNLNKIELLEVSV